MSCLSLSTFSLYFNRYLSPKIILESLKNLARKISNFVAGFFCPSKSYTDASTNTHIVSPIQIPERSLSEYTPLDTSSFLSPVLPGSQSMPSPYYNVDRAD